RPAPSREERAANQEAYTRLALAFRQQQARRALQVRRLVLMKEPPPVPLGGVCVGPSLEALARLYPDPAIIAVGFGKEAVRVRWPQAEVSEAASPPAPRPGDRWVYYDPAALDGEGGWRLAHPA
ncbi:hypothetical protein, partial [Thermus sp.]|uniref:hypothetical protein n=1 Tax=Thermus sp. TaxID=275 RepID=UPI0025DDAF79